MDDKREAGRIVSQQPAERRKVSELSPLLSLASRRLPCAGALTFLRISADSPHGNLGEKKTTKPRILSYLCIMAAVAQCHGVAKMNRGGPRS